MPTAEQMADRFVSFTADEPHHVRLTAPGCDEVVLGPYPNPALAKEKAEAVRLFVAAAIRAAAAPEKA